MFDGERGISYVLSLLLLVIVVFGVGILLYNFVMGTVRNVTESSVQPFSLVIENIAINNSCITVYIRNSSNKDVEIDRVYVDDKPTDFLPDNRVAIPKDSLGKVYVPGSYMRGAFYKIKLVTSSGYTLFSVRRY